MKEKLIEQITALATAALGLVAALAWNSAIQELFKQLFGAQSGLFAMFSYAIIVTLIAFFTIYFIGKAGERAKTLSIAAALRRKK